MHVSRKKFYALNFYHETYKEYECNYLSAAL